MDESSREELKALQEQIRLGAEGRQARRPKKAPGDIQARMETLREELVRLCGTTCARLLKKESSGGRGRVDVTATARDEGLDG